MQQHCFDPLVEYIQAALKSLAKETPSYKIVLNIHNQLHAALEECVKGVKNDA